MMQVNLNFCDLTNANLQAVKLAGARIYGTELEGADFNQAIFLATAICYCNLSQAKNLDLVVHEAGSSVGMECILLSGGFMAEEFLRGTGVPEEFIQGLPALFRAVEYQSCFIAYGEPDREFAEQLKRELMKLKISCWVYSMDYTPGEHTQREIKARRQGAGKFVVLCSVKGLLRDGVLKEIEDQIDEDREKIIAISLDNIWKAEGFPVKRGARDLKPSLRERNYLNFEEGSDYERELQRLLKALRR